jgi:hypothetical protein
MATEVKSPPDEEADSAQLVTLRRRVTAAAQEIERDARISARCHFRAATFWSTVFYLIGLPTTVLAAVAGVSAIENHSTTAAVLALTVAGLSATTTFLNAGERAHAHSKKRAQYEGLKNRARHFRTVEAPFIDERDRLAEGLGRLDATRDQLQRESPQVRMKSWERAAKEVEKKLPRGDTPERAPSG